MRRPAQTNEPPELFTIGHSTHPLDRFQELISEHRIVALADVRSFPSSRRWPQFNQPALRESMAGAGVAYHWIRTLGGRRHDVREASPHTAWRHPAFRSYADYADSGDFERGLDELTGLARASRCACMCSEGLWWRCHRRIIADHLTVMGWRVMHILPDGKLSQHVLPDFATLVDGRLVYNGTAARTDQ